MNDIDILERLRQWYDNGNDMLPVMREAADEIERLRKLTDNLLKFETNWLPIATVPKDGTLILLALPHRPDDPAKGGYSFDVAAWDDEDWKGWRGEDSLWQPDLPTHWMPLPEAPKDLP